MAGLTFKLAFSTEKGVESFWSFPIPILTIYQILCRFCYLSRTESICIREGIYQSICLLGGPPLKDSKAQNPFSNVNNKMFSRMCISMKTGRKRRKLMPKKQFEILKLGISIYLASFHLQKHDWYTHNSTSAFSLPDLFYQPKKHKKRRGGEARILTLPVSTECSRRFFSKVTTKKKGKKKKTLERASRETSLQTLVQLLFGGKLGFFFFWNIYDGLLYSFGSYKLYTMVKLDICSWVRNFLVLYADQSIEPVSPPLSIHGCPEFYTEQHKG